MRVTREGRVTSVMPEAWAQKEAGLKGQHRVSVSHHRKWKPVDDAVQCAPPTPWGDLHPQGQTPRYLLHRYLCYCRPHLRSCHGIGESSHHTHPHTHTHTHIHTQTHSDGSGKGSTCSINKCFLIGSEHWQTGTHWTRTRAFYKYSLNRLQTNLKCTERSSHLSSCRHTYAHTQSEQKLDKQVNKSEPE